MRADVAALLTDKSLTGIRWCRAHSDLTDAWLRDLFRHAAGGDCTGVALVAVGGYGRRELFPASDLDLVLVQGRGVDVAPVADRLWYPIWDAGARLSHSVRTIDQALSLARGDLDSATSLLSTRHLAGDEALSTALEEGAHRQWTRYAKRSLTTLADRVDSRHEHMGEVAFLLEPDLKEGRGGMRDAHAMRWAEASRRLLLESDDRPLDRAYGVLADARVELQRLTGQTTNRLSLQDQDAVAAALDFEDADALMRSIAASARRLAWASDDMWQRVRSSLRGPIGRLARRDRTIRPGLFLRDGEVRVDSVELEPDVSLGLQAATASVTHDAPLARDTLALLGDDLPPLPSPWPPAACAVLVELLLTGHRAIPVIEALDQIGLWVRMLPEWSSVQCKPQRNAYHRFTVDRHLVETAANAGERAGGVDRPDLLVVGALLHDIGKGFPGDHTEVGMEIVPDIGARMGFVNHDVDVLVSLVANHLLLPDVATRRDLDDPGTIERVASIVGSTTRLQLLSVLTEADSLATGASAWGSWKAGLVSALVERVDHVLRGGAAADVASEHQLTRAQQVLLDAERPHIQAANDELLVVAPDEAGLFARVTGVLTLHGVLVLAASAHSDARRWVLDQFKVESEFGGSIDWSMVTADIERALFEPATLESRIDRKIANYRDRRPKAAHTVTAVRFDNDISILATVIEVHAPDRIGLLYRLTSTFAAAGLDIRSARVQTMGPHAVDSFYVRDHAGQKITDPTTLEKLEQDILAALHG